MAWVYFHYFLRFPDRGKHMTEKLDRDNVIPCLAMLYLIMAGV